MASSKTLKGDPIYGDRYFQLKCTQKQNIQENSSTISWELSAHGDSDISYPTGPTKVIINGTTVYSVDRKDSEYKKFPTMVGSTDGTITVKHTSDGSKTIKVEFSTAVYGTTVHGYIGDWELDEIPRYATSVQSLKSKTETSITMNWSSDSTIDYLWYSKDNGSNWKGVDVTDGKSGSYTISGLASNTAYEIKTRVRRKDSQLTTDSSKLSVTTYDYPHCTNAPDFVLGNELTLSFYNPLSRDFVFYIIGNGTQIDVEYKCSTTSYKGVNNSTSSVAYLYATIPNTKSATYSVRVEYSGKARTKQGGKYSIKESECYPTFPAFTYKDTNTAITAVTGSNQALVKGLSSLSVEISTANKMVAQNGATSKYYGVNIDTINKNANYNASSAVTIPVGEISSAGAKRLDVRAYDSRGLSTLKYKDVTVYDYNKPKITASAKRVNNFGAQTTLKIGGEYSRLTINGADKNTIKTVKYRSRQTGGTWDSYVTLTPKLSAGKFTCADIVLTFDNTKSFEIEIVVTDNFGTLTTTKETLTVDIGQAVFFISSNKKKAYINGVEVATIDNIRQTKYFTQLAEGTDLNAIVEEGTYRSIQASHTHTMKNVPSGLDGGFTLHVLNWTTTESNEQHRRQELIYGRMTYFRRTIDAGATWSEWNTTAYIEDLCPVGSIYCNTTNTNPASKLGGTWALADKGFTPYCGNDTTIFTPTSNVVVNSAHITRSHSTIRICLSLAINTTLNDTGLALGTFNWEKVGITNMPMGYGKQVAYSDGAKGGIVWNLDYTGGLNVLNVIEATSLESGHSYSLDFTFNVVPNTMVNSFCDKFYWKRTA